MNISIFARPYFFGDDVSIGSGLFLHRGTSFVRGEQMAEYLGAKYNPEKGYDNDICIYLKPKTLDKIKDKDYVDVSDSGDYLIELLKERPKIKLIASSLVSYEYLKERLKNKIVLIPEHHCNFEQIKRSRQDVTTGGYISVPSVQNYSVTDEVRKRLKKIGLNFITCFNFKNRQDVLDFYKQIDIQIIGHFGFVDNSEVYRHPTKIISAASFGIPTIANWKLGYKEIEGSYIQSRNMDSMIEEVKKMKNKDYYNKFANKIIKSAEPYHISKIAEKYRSL